MTPRTKQAFSLVELSIVLVILGLLVGGILAGQSLIRAAELRSVGTDYQKYMTAMHAFRDKYFAIPGDMPIATSVWGRQVNAAHCVTNSAAGVVSTGTCDGNGDGQTVWAATGAESGESYQFWRQMAAAGLLQGNYSGLADGTTGESSTSANSPSSRIATALWHIMNSGTSTTGSTAMFDGNYGQNFRLAAVAANSFPGGNIFIPEELWNIDTKLDDGKPATGQFVIRTNSGFNTCTTASASTTLTADYLLSSRTVACSLVIRRIF